MSVPKLSHNSPYPAVSHASRSANWTHDETQILVDVWEELDQQLTNEDPLLSNKMIIARAIRRLQDMGYDRSQAQVQFKLKQLRHKYRTLVAGRAQGQGRLGTGRRAAHWEFFEQVHRIFTRSRPAGAPGTSEAAESQAKRSSTGAKSASQASRSVLPSTSKSAASDTGASPTAGGGTAAGRRAGSQPGTGPPVVPSLPDVPESGEEDEDDFEDDEDDGELDETEGDDIQDLFGQIQDQDAENETDMSAEMSAETNGKKSVEPGFASFTPTAKSNKRSAASSSQQNPKKPRGRPRAGAPPRDDLTVAQAITDAVMRFIDHQSFHLTEQTKLLQRYLKFERARMRWEMDMETRRMKWEEEREMREEERRQRQEELQAKRVSDNREFMLQMAVVLGNGAAAKTKDSTKNC